MTGRPGRNFRVAGLGVDSVSISMRRMWDASALCARWYTCARIDRHSALAACKWQLPALPVLTCRKHRSEEHTSELQSLMRISYAVFCLKKKKPHTNHSINQ